VRSDAEVFNAQLRAMCAEAGQSLPPIAVDALARIRTRIDDLFRAWSTVGPGESMELRFESSPASSAR
jgi:hypothetical protein